MKHFVIIGGGAAGFFAAINAAEMNPNLKITLLEGSKNVLQKVKVSGGGRCNVTHACFTPKELIEFYPRGGKELLGPFHQFMTGDTFEWFDRKGIPLKIEEDNRVFPESNRSQTIIDCFLNEAKRHHIEIKRSTRVTGVKPISSGYLLNTNCGSFKADYLLIATGSNTNFWNVLASMGHTIVSPVPSLFTFNINDPRVDGIPGVVVKNASVNVMNSKLNSEGPVLVTHWGLSGPAILKLSAWGAIEFYSKNYEFKVEINWLGRGNQQVLEELNGLKATLNKKIISLKSPFEEIPKRLWEKLCIASGIKDVQWAQLSKKQLVFLAKQLTNSVFQVSGKSTFKEEFVTAGGVHLKEIDFKRFESRMFPNLFFAGEVLNIDAVTGGFNFQNAWTGAWIVAKSIADKN